MRFCVLGSGSKGNATFVESGKTRILIDAGFSGVEIERRMDSVGLDSRLLTAILVTHEHTDHVKGVGVLSRRLKIPVYANAGTMRAAFDGKAASFSLCEFGTGEPFTIQDLHIHPFAISHDAADPVGFHVTDGRCSLGYCTDTGMISRLIRHRLGNVNGLVLECNHDPDMLRQGPYPLYLQQRVLSKTGHLANRDALTFLLEIMHHGLLHVVLSHISETNNRPDIIRGEIKAFMNGCAHERTNISLARQDRAGRLVRLT